MNKLIELDNKIYGSIIKNRNLYVESFFLIFTHLGDGILWASIYVLIFLVFPATRHLIFVIVVAELMGLFTVIILKNITHRKRPAQVKFFFPWNRYSFPSAHTNRAFLIATVLSLNYLQYLPIFVFWAFLVGYSRIYLKKHYPFDVLAGIFTGILSALISLKITG